ncbi:MAG: sigma-54-dependent Fis family transcriptional regulator [Chitinophagaceae bacterium]|nr:sigma-54-dependent Fis family transcriptional regulator [Oligoflexus sp.]
MNQRNVFDGSLTSDLDPSGMERTSLFAGGSLRQVFSEIVGKSEAMEAVLQTVGKIARSDAPVLIRGESGTGKELIAKALHRMSNRAGKHLVSLNCSAIPESLLEAELFGHVKGAFTGADKARQGYFEKAHGGTLFLDEIGDMPINLQAKLLRVLQEKQYVPIGSTEPRFADVRIITATNVDLDEAVGKQKFRSDLYYRLNVLPIVLPPLRERKGDVRLLLDHTLNVFNQTHSILNPCYFNGDVYQTLDRYNWPGNVRELINLIERLVVMSGGGEIDLSALPVEIKNSKAGATAKQVEAPYFFAETPGIAPDASVVELLPLEGLNLESYIEQLENTLIMQALERTGNNKNQAAKLLGLNRTTLVERIKKRKLVPLNAPSKEL